MYLILRTQVCNFRNYGYAFNRTFYHFMMFGKVYLPICGVCLDFDQQMQGPKSSKIFLNS